MPSRGVVYNAINLFCFFSSLYRFLRNWDFSQDDYLIVFIIQLFPLAKVIFPQQEVRILGLDFCHWPPYTHPLTKLPRGSDGALKPGPTSPDPCQSICSVGTSQNMGCGCLMLPGAVSPTLDCFYQESYHWYTDRAGSCQWLAGQYSLLGAPIWNPLGEQVTGLLGPLVLTDPQKHMIRTGLSASWSSWRPLPFIT